MRDEVHLSVAEATQRGELIEAVRAVPPLNPGEPVRIPSERAYRERERRRKEGIPVDRAVYDQLRALAERAQKK
jgi:LDH2 family malate/lactate/ureidoglycolate dehydrogenase